MGDIVETVTGIVPHLGISLIHFTGTKAAQSDTVTFSGYRVVYWAAAFVDGGSDWLADTVTRTDATVNQIILTGATTGTVYGIALCVV